VSTAHPRSRPQPEKAAAAPSSGGDTIFSGWW
jgi:hypothetical protein